MRNFDKYSALPNLEAKNLFTSDKEAYLIKVSECVESSLSRVYDTPEPGCLLIFTEPKPAHYNLRLEIIGAPTETGEDVPTDDAPTMAFYDASNEVLY